MQGFQERIDGQGKKLKQLQAETQLKSKQQAKDVAKALRKLEANIEKTSERLEAHKQKALPPASSTASFCTPVSAETLPNRAISRWNSATSLGTNARKACLPQHQLPRLPPCAPVHRLYACL